MPFLILKTTVFLTNLGYEVTLITLENTKLNNNSHNFEFFKHFRLVFKSLFFRKNVDFIYTLLSSISF